MDALRLLSRSSGLKIKKNNRTHFQHSSQPLPSAAGNHHELQQDEAEKSNRKRKFHEVEAENEPFCQLSDTEIRQLQKQHRIKITNLRALHRQNKSGSRKAHKEESRLFPQPLQSFTQLISLSVNEALIANIDEQAFEEPTEVQLATIPLLLASGDKEPNLLTVAPTGSGKTLSFLIPLIDKISKSHEGADPDERHVNAIILAPTKELVSQIMNEGRKLVVNTGVRISEMRKGMRLFENDAVSSLDSDVDDDEQQIQSTVVRSDILVSTPLSLVHVIKPDGRADLPQSIPGISNLVLDEADVLLDPLFREQTLAIWSACSSATLRTSLWSATIGASIEELAISTINDYQKANKIVTWNIPLIRTIIGLKDTSLPHINHRLIYASTEPGKLMGLRQLLRPAPSIAETPAQLTRLRPPFIIFTQTITRAQSLYDELQYDIPPSAGGSTRIAVLHSSLSSKQRSATMTAFRQGKIWILITTDLLSRGVDFRGVNGVVNYDIPITAASYVHRAGRTGRAGRKGGIVVTYYTHDDVKYLKPIANMIAASESNSTSQSSIAKIDQERSQQPQSTSTSTSTPGPSSSLPAWLIPSLPRLTKSNRKNLKQRGVEERRAIKKSDDDQERRRKLKNRIGTGSGYERKLAERKHGMIQGSLRRQQQKEQREISNADDDYGSDDDNKDNNVRGGNDDDDDFEDFGD